MFHTYVANVLSGCCIWFTMVFKCFFYVFLQVFKVHVSSVSSTFRRMLQVPHLDVSKVDRVLHLSLRFLLPRLGSPPPSASWHPPPPPPLLDVGDVRGGAGPMWTRKTAWMVREMVARAGVWTSEH
jgi:hypothetical protein